jgi:hypothetical protein
MGRRDGRRKAARLLKTFEADLTQSLGHEPTVRERQLIQNAALLRLVVARAEAKILAGVELSQHAQTHYIAAANALTRALQALGAPETAAEPVEPATKPRNALAEYLRRRAQEPVA